MTPSELVVERDGEALADAVRELIEQVAASTAPDAALAEATSAVRAATERLRAAGTGRRITFRTDAGRDGMTPGEYRRLNPLSGVLNPLAPPAAYEETAGGTIEARVTFGVAYQGPPGYVHGAFIAGVFDDVLGVANLASGHPGMTVRLEVRYLRATPLHTPLRVVARHTRREGRRIFASATMHAGDRVTAEADGVFAEITVDRAKELFGRDRLGTDQLGGRAHDAAL
ncbi:MAG TPA: PaaI family thioesterase [Candidatus Dormibacteraeota bacterium]|jgi:acyl-coenzyme A thioesterase PaaI-like protein